MRAIKLTVLIALPLVVGFLVFAVTLPLYKSYNPFSYKLLSNPFPGHVPTPPEAVVMALPVPDWAWRWRQWDKEDVEKGKKLYKANCASCHGKDLDGRGEWSLALNFPAPPADFRAPDSPLVHHSIQHLFWRINEGGIQNQFNSAMPAWGTLAIGAAGRRETVHTGDLSAEEIWEILRYLYRATEKPPVIQPMAGAGGH